MQMTRFELKHEDARHRDMKERDRVKVCVSLVLIPKVGTQGKQNKLNLFICRAFLLNMRWKLEIWCARKKAFPFKTFSWEVLFGNEVNTRFLSNGICESVRRFSFALFSLDVFVLSDSGQPKTAMKFQDAGNFGWAPGPLGNSPPLHGLNTRTPLSCPVPENNPIFLSIIWKNVGDMLWWGGLSPGPLVYPPSVFSPSLALHSGFAPLAMIYTRLSSLKPGAAFSSQ